MSEVTDADVRALLERIAHKDRRRVETPPTVEEALALFRSTPGLAAVTTDRGVLQLVGRQLVLTPLPRA